MKENENLLLFSKLINNNQNIVEIPLKYHSCFGYKDNRESAHPKHLLDGTGYSSRRNKELRKEKSDWIIFEIDDNQFQSYFIKYFQINNDFLFWWLSRCKINGNINRKCKYK